VQNYRIWLSPPALAAHTSEAISAALASNWIAPAGPALEAFETELTALHGHRPTVATVSGTAALHLAMLAAGIEPGDEVLVPDFTYAATAHAVAYCNALPVLVDTEDDSPQLSPHWLRIAAADRRAKGRPLKAVVVAHLYGRAAPMGEVAAICQEYELMLIEDAAEALGVWVDGRRVGTWGELAALSFNGNKLITTGGGGALICQNPTQHSLALALGQQARIPAEQWAHSGIGYNYRLSNVLAALGLAQLPQLDWHIAQRQQIDLRYRLLLSESEGWHFFSEKDFIQPNYWLTTCWLDGALETTPDQVIGHLAQSGIEARRLWRPLREHPSFAACPFYGFRRGDFWFARGLCLPTGSQLTEAEQAEIVALCRAVLRMHH
jgi:pyridoxal phosphate-dependent aminotransferase EpsN